MNDGDRLGALRRWLRPVNLTLIQQGLWPLLLLLSGGPRVTEPAELPWDWWGVRVGAAALAALLAILFIRRDPDARSELTRILPGGGSASLRTQAAFALLLLPVMVAAARLVAEPGDVATKIILFGAVDALAYQAIAFGVTRPLFRPLGWGAGAALICFASSWAFRDLILAIIGDSLSSPFFSLVGGALTGALICLAATALRRWPGGFWPAWAAQWLVVSLIAGFS